MRFLDERVGKKRAIKRNARSHRTNRRAARPSQAPWATGKKQRRRETEKAVLVSNKGEENRILGCLLSEVAKVVRRTVEEAI